MPFKTAKMSPQLKGKITSSNIQHLFSEKMWDSSKCYWFCCFPSSLPTKPTEGKSPGHDISTIRTTIRKTTRRCFTYISKLPLAYIQNGQAHNSSGCKILSEAIGCKYRTCWAGWKEGSRAGENFLPNKKLPLKKSYKIQSLFWVRCFWIGVTFHHIPSSFLGGRYVHVQKKHVHFRIVVVFSFQNVYKHCF